MQIIKGKITKPPRILIHGANKIGKTTFGAQAFKPIFILTEDGADNVGVDRFPLARDTATVAAQLQQLLTEPHEYKTLVIDSLDWLEKMIHKDIAAKAGVDDISKIKYGVGYQSAALEIGTLLAYLDKFRDEKGMAIVLIAHSVVKRYDSPEVEPYDRFIPRLHEKACNLVCDWADAVGFAELDIETEATEVGFNKKIVRGVSTGRRVLRLQGKPAYVAGNRLGLPASCKLETAWDTIRNTIIGESK